MNFPQQKSIFPLTFITLLTNFSRQFKEPSHFNLSFSVIVRNLMRLVAVVSEESVCSLRSKDDVDVKDDAALQ